MRISRASWIAASFLCLIALVAACAGTSNEDGDANTVAIQALLDAPETYDDQTVRVIGTVTGSTGALGTGGYEVNDGTGTLMVLTDEGIPDEGLRVSVEGEFEAEHLIGEDSLIVLKEKNRRAL
jgi:hypothetical protein